MIGLDKLFDSAVTCLYIIKDYDIDSLSRVIIRCALHNREPLTLDMLYDQTNIVIAFVINFQYILMRYDFVNEHDGEPYLI